MAIRKTPICPFCHSDMAEMNTTGSLESRGIVEIPIKTEYEPNSDKRFIKEEIHLTVFQCAGCGFVALWSGKP